MMEENRPEEKLQENKQRMNEILSSGYEDMLDLPHHVSTKHAQMSLRDRAAQFAPYAALTGYQSVIKTAEEEMGQEDPYEHVKIDALTGNICE